MEFFKYQDDGQLYAEGCAVETLAKQYGTPLYLYSRQALEQAWSAFDEAAGEFPHLVCFAVKANSNLAVLNVLARLGSGFDIVSGGELARVLAAGGDAGKVVFSGVAKNAAEIRAALTAGIKCFNVESIAELDRINAVAAELGVKAPISLRVNPDVDAKTHPYISTGLKENKFGINIDDALAIYQQAAAMSNLQVVGLDCHIGSQLTELAPFGDAIDKLLALVDKLAAVGIQIEHFDVGGLGICYTDETPPAIADYVAAVLAKVQGRGFELLFEPGRAICGNAGILVTQVEFLKPTAGKNFVIIDAAMNDLIRPSLYSAYQRIEPVRHNSAAVVDTYDVVGPVCETGDFLGKDRQLAVAAGDYLAVFGSGAYGFTMSSNYNSRGRAAEVMVDASQAHLVRAREKVEDLFRDEQLLP